MEEKLFFLIKFTQEKYIKDLQEGKLYCKNLNYYRNLEEQYNDRDMGDKNEGKFLLNDVKLEVYRNKDTKHILTISSNISTFDRCDVKKKPVFCMTGIKKSDIKDFYDKEKGGYIVKFSELLKEMIGKSYWEAAVLITNFPKFCEKLYEKCKKDSINIKMEPVKYTDMKINYIDRINDFVKDNSNTVFYKDNYYKGQYEYRIVIDNMQVDDYYQLDIGDMSDIIKVFRKKELLEFLNTEYLIKVE